MKTKPKNRNKSSLDIWLEKMHKETGLSKATLYYARGIFGLSNIRFSK
jgi:hypothetical protein